jgi:two-component system response regulator FixJ
MLNSICNRLSPRETQVLFLVVAGERQKKIASSMGISPRTVEIHQVHIRKKLGARNVQDVIRIALRGNG